MATPHSSYHLIASPSLGEAWIACMDFVLTRGLWIDDDDRQLCEVTRLDVSVEGVSHDDPVINELANQKRIALMAVKYRSCGVVPPYKISYGALLYENNGVNQIEWVVERLRARPTTKSATVALHAPGQDSLSCLSLLDFKIRDGRVGMTAVYRSQNIYASQPGNVLALCDVQRTVARQLGRDVGPLFLSILSAHIYEEDIVAARHIVERHRSSGTA